MKTKLSRFGLRMRAPFLPPSPRSRDARAVVLHKVLRRVPPDAPPPTPGQLEAGSSGAYPGLIVKWPALDV